MNQSVTLNELIFLRLKPLWNFFRREHFSFWMICGYLVAELVRPQELFPSLPKLPWAQIALIGAIAGAFLDSTVKWVRAKPNLWIICFLLAILASTAFAIFPEISRAHIMDCASWVIVYFLFINIVNTKERVFISVLIYLIAAGKIAIGCAKIWAMRGFSFASWGLTGPPGFFQNSGELAVLMVMLFPLAFFIYMGIKNRIQLYERLFLIALWVCSVTVIMGASSRGSQVALAIQIAIMARRALFRPKSLIIISCVVATLWFFLPDEQKLRFSETGKDKSSLQRKLYWEHGWDMMKEHPALGVGYFNFIPYYEQNYSYDMLYNFAQLPHNIFVQVGTDAGFIGLFLFLGILIPSLTIPIHVYRNKNTSEIEKAMACGLGYGALGFIVAGQFVTITYYPFLWLNLAMSVALANTAKYTKPGSPQA